VQSIGKNSSIEGELSSDIVHSEENKKELSETNINSIKEAMVSLIKD
jgi:hypothetical protein